jgi:outer membrane protein assembly factor BamB
VSPTADATPTTARFYAARGVAVVAAAFSAIICVLVIAGFLQARAIDPLNSPALQSLVDSLSQDPANEELQQQVRALDLLARRAYFTSRWQLRTGGALLLGGIATLLVALRVMSSERRKLPLPAGPGEDQSWLMATRTRKWVTASGATLLGVTVLAAVLSHSELSSKTPFAGGPVPAVTEPDADTTEEVAGDDKVAAVEPQPEAATAPLSEKPPVEIPAPQVAEPQAVAAAAEPRATEAVKVAAVEPTPTPVAVDTPVPSQPAAAAKTGPGSIWANFRGPGGNGIAAVSSAPTDWDGDSGKGVKWKVEVPRQGYSSPVVVKSRVLVTGADKKVREVYCYDADSGKLMWRKEVPGHSGEAPKVHGDTGYAAPSMATDGSRVFAIYATGDLIGLDLDGNQLWTRSLGVPKNHFGHSSSLITHENLLIVQWDQSADGKLLGVDGTTGKDVWKVERKMISWSSPICVNTGSRFELILTDGKSVTSFNPKSGARLWGEDCLSGDMGPSAAFSNGMVFVANDYAIAAGIRLDVLAPEIVWEYDEVLPDTASPVASGGFVFIAASYGVISCLNARTGAVLWEQEYDDGFYASPIVVGDSVYAVDLQGVTHIFKVAGEHTSVGTPALGETSACTPAVVDGRIYMRGEKHLFCITGA